MIRVRLNGLSRLQRHFGALEQPLTDLARQVRIRLHNQHERRVASEKTTPDGVAWEPLAPSTLARKRGGSLLVDTGRLLGSFVSRQSGLIVTEDNQARPYAAWINDGTKRMPAREFMGIGAEGRDEILDVCRMTIRRRLG